MAESLLDREFLARLEYLHVVTRELFVGHVAADRGSKKFGVGMEFADYRSYAPGDDFRYIDWAAFARRGDLLIKMFTEEQAARLYLVIDASRSMSLGQPEKLLFAKKVAAALGYIGLANLDPVTVLAFDSGLRELGRTFQGRGQLRAMLSFLDAIHVDGYATSMSQAFRQFTQRYTHQRGLVLLVSDFLDREGYEDAIRLLHYHRFDLVAVQTNAREEIDPPFTGDVELIDSESGERSTVPMTPDLLAAYRVRFEEHYAELARLCKVLRRVHLPAVTDMPFEDLILNVFRRGGIVQ